MMYLSLRHHDNEQIPTTTTSLRLPPQGGSTTRRWDRAGLRRTLPVSAAVPHLSRRRSLGLCQLPHHDPLLRHVDAWRACS